MLVDHGERQADELPRPITVRLLNARLRRQAVAWP
jgi:hypothetical protein